MASRDAEPVPVAHAPVGISEMATVVRPSYAGRRRTQGLQASASAAATILGVNAPGKQANMIPKGGVKSGMPSGVRPGLARLGRRKRRPNPRKRPSLPSSLLVQPRKGLRQVRVVSYPGSHLGQHKGPFRPPSSTHFRLP